MCSAPSKVDSRQLQSDSSHLYIRRSCLEHGVMLDAILFDIGDTLMHFETSQARRFIEAGVRPVHERLIERGHAPPPLTRYARRIRRAFVRAYLASRIVRREVRTLEVLRRVHARMAIALEPSCVDDLATECIRPFERFFTTDAQAVPVVSRLHEAGFKLGIVSNTFFPHFAIDEVLEREGLLSYFTVRIYSSDVGYMKPHPAIFRTALHQLGVAAERTMHVGDLAHKDVKGARRVGIKSTLIRHGRETRAVRPRPDFIVQSLRELLALPGIAERIGRASSTPAVAV